MFSMGLVLHGHKGSGTFEHGHSHGSSSHGHSHSRSSSGAQSQSGEDPEVVRPSRLRQISLSAYGPQEEFSHVNRSTNINVRAAFVHVLGDLAQSIGVLIAAIIIKL